MLCETIIMICVLCVMPLIVVLILVLIDRNKGDIKIVPPNNKQKSECKEISDKELREAFLKEYINYADCAWIKLNSLPKYFKIGNVYFNKCVEGRCYYLEFLSYVLVDGKIYDNGSLSIDFKFSFNTTNKDLIDYILNNLDKVEEVKQ